jgi:KUP system potassium uptake protein
MQFVKIQPFFKVIAELKEDITVPKYATNLVYLSKANYKTDIESKIMYSIINKQPKRADYYWMLHLDRVDEPNTFEYTFEELVPNVLFRVNLRLGFKIQPLINLYFRQIIDELVHNKEFDIRSNYPSLRNNEIPGDFRFIIIHRVFNQNQVTRFWERFSLSFYNMIKQIGISDANAYGLDTSSVYVESVPLVVDTSCKIIISRASR